MVHEHMSVCVRSFCLSFCPAHPFHKNLWFWPKVDTLPMDQTIHSCFLSQVCCDGFTCRTRNTYNNPDILLFYEYFNTCTAFWSSILGWHLLLFSQNVFINLTARIVMMKVSKLLLLNTVIYNINSFQEWPTIVFELGVIFEGHLAPLPTLCSTSLKRLHLCQARRQEGPHTRLNIKTVLKLCPKNISEKFMQSPQ